VIAAVDQEPAPLQATGDSSQTLPLPLLLVGSAGLLAVGLLYWFRCG
jgi:hypothetical protein